MRKFSLELCYKGNRNYIQGTEIYININRVLTELYADANLSEFSMFIQKFTHKQNDMVISEPGESVIYPEGFSARFSCNSSKGKIAGYFIENNDDVQSRYPFNEEEIVKQCTVDDCLIQFHGKTTYSTIEVVVAMTKFLHLHKFNEECQGKWAFSKLEIMRPFNEKDKNDIRIKIIRKLGFKLTKSQIISNNEVLGSIFFSLVGED